MSARLNIFTNNKLTMTNIKQILILPVLVMLISVVGAGAGICTACGQVGFTVLSTFGATAATTLSFLTIHEIPLRIVAIAILIGTYFLMVKPKPICILNPWTAKKTLDNSY